MNAEKTQNKLSAASLSFPGRHFNVAEGSKLEPPTLDFIGFDFCSLAIVQHKRH